MEDLASLAWCKSDLAHLRRHSAQFTSSSRITTIEQASCRSTCVHAGKRLTGGWMRVVNHVSGAMIFAFGFYAIVAAFKK